MRIPWTDPAATSRRQSCGGSRRAPARRRAGGAGARTCPSASGARSARTTRPTATPGTYLPHDHARSRAYRWGEDGLLGISDDQGRLCFALALWNGSDPILKERLFGADRPRGQPRRGRQGALLVPRRDADPQLPAGGATAIPQAAFPYADLVAENAAPDEGRPRVRAGRHRRASPTAASSTSRSSTPRPGPRTSLIRYHGHEPGPGAGARSTCCPTLWFRNTWAWGRHDDPPDDPATAATDAGRAEPASRGRSGRSARLGPGRRRRRRAAVHRERDERRAALRGARTPGRTSRTRFERGVVDGAADAVEPGADRVEGRRPLRARRWRPARPGSCACVSRRSSLPRRPTRRPRTRRRGPSSTRPTARRRRRGHRRPAGRGGRVLRAARGAPARADDERLVQRQAFAGLIWCKQFYALRRRPSGSTAIPPSRLRPPERRAGRNADWRHTEQQPTSCRCPTPGSTRGSRPGTSPSTASRWP